MRIESLNKTALIAGGTDGVGLSVVNALVKKNYDVYFIGSNADKGAKVEAQLKASVGGEHKAVIQFIQLDLSDIAAVKKFSIYFLKRVDRLDILLFSAGVVFPKRQESSEGIECTFAIGFLSAYVLSHALIPLLEKGENARVLTVSGGGPIVLKERLEFDDLNYTKKYNGFNAAARTVHAKVVLTQILAERLSDKGIDSNTLHPGIVKSGLGRNMPWPLSVAFKVASQLMPKDSKTAIHAALSESLNGVSGKFLYNKKQIPLKFGEAYISQLIKETEKILADI